MNRSNRSVSIRTGPIFKTMGSSEFGKGMRALSSILTSSRGRWL